MCRLLVPTTFDVTCLWTSHAVVGARLAARGTPQPELCFVLEERLAKTMVREGGGKGFVGQACLNKAKENSIFVFCWAGLESNKSRPGVPRKLIHYKSAGVTGIKIIKLHVAHHKDGISVSVSVKGLQSLSHEFGITQMDCPMKMESSE